MSRLPQSVRGLPVLLVSLVAAHVVLKLLLAPRALQAPLQGDEVSYADGARAMANLVRELFSSTPVDLGPPRDSVIGNGWFMPGMSIVLTPVYYLFPHAGSVLVRAYLGLLTTLLLLLTVHVARRDLGYRYAVVLLIFPGLLPMWVLYSYTAWGDLAAGMTAVILVALLVRLTRTLLAGEAPSLRFGMVLGLVAITTLYLRSSALPLVGGLLGLTLVGIIAFSHARSRRRALTTWVVALAVFAALLMPWSIAVSRTFGSRVITTTTVPLSLAVAFGDPGRACFGPCDPGNIWFHMVRYSRQVAAATGGNELEVQKHMSSYALRGVTPHSYAVDVAADANRYLLQPSGFEVIFRDPPGSAPDVTTALTRWATDALYFLVLALSAVGIFTVVRRDVADQVLSLLLKLAGAALVLQPFLHISSPRYWPVLAPMMAALAVFSMSTILERRRAVARGVPLPSATATERWLTRLQLVAVAGWALVLLTITGLAL